MSKIGYPFGLPPWTQSPRNFPSTVTFLLSETPEHHDLVLDVAHEVDVAPTMVPVRAPILVCSRVSSFARQLVLNPRNHGWGSVAHSAPALRCSCLGFGRSKQNRTIRPVALLRRLKQPRRRDMKIRLQGLQPRMSQGVSGFFLEKMTRQLCFKRATNNNNTSSRLP